MRVVILNGPNLNLLGKREPGIYGSEDMESCLARLRSVFKNCEIIYHQSNLEGDLINWLHQYGTQTPDKAHAVIINPGGYAHTSVAIADAVSAIEIPVYEVHISNIYKRESIRHTLITGARAAGIITGFGMYGYELAIRASIRL